MNLVKIVVYILLLILIGLVGEYSFNGNAQSPGYWLVLIVIGWFMYNIIAYYRGWTMHFGIGGYIKENDHSQERTIGVIVSFLVVGFAIIQWIRLFF